jgi:hypothetical protein
MRNENRDDVSQVIHTDLVRTLVNEVMSMSKKVAELSTEIKSLRHDMHTELALGIAKQAEVCRAERKSGKLSYPPRPIVLKSLWWKVGIGLGGVVTAIVSWLVAR